MRYFYILWTMGRPLFLIGIVPLYALGVTAAWHDETVLRITPAVAGLVLVWLVQLMTHYSNEYWDLETDSATAIFTRISGGSRALVRKLVPRTAARIAALTCLLLAVALSVVMMVAMDTGAGLLYFVGAAALLGWFYSAEPLKLESAGLGEVTTVVVSCFLLPLISYYLQTSILNLRLLVACLPLGLLTLALILTAEIPDIEADQATGKRTLVVRLGITRTKSIIGSLLVAGWIYFSVFIIYRWPFWGWIASAVGLAFLVILGLRMRDAAFLRPAKIEKTGLMISLLLGAASVCLALSFLSLKY